MQKMPPKALDYILLHHVSRAYLKSLKSIAEGRRDEIVSEVYEESIMYLSEFIDTYQVSEKGLSVESRSVLRIIRMSTKGSSRTTDNSSKSVIIH